MKPVSSLISCFCLLFGANAQGETSAEAEVSRTVRAAFDAMNRNDMKVFEAFYESTAVLVDDTRPYVWTGPGAVKAWEADEDLWAKQNAVMSVSCVLSQVVRDEVAGDRAYFVGRGSCDVVMNGVKKSQAGVWTAVLHHSSAGWRASLMSFGGEALAVR